MGVITKTIYQCDLCGTESDNIDFNNGYECGHSEIFIKGNEGAMSYGGNWGGLRHDDSYYICFRCSKRIRDFMNSLSSKSGDKK